MSLTKALNSRLSNQAAAVPVTEAATLLVLDTYENSAPPPRPATEVVRAVRAPVPGELGGRSMPVYPEVEYTPEAFRALLTRMVNGCNYMIEHLGDEQGQAQIGYFCDLAEAVQCMGIAHATKGILER